MKFFTLALALFASLALVSVTSAAPNVGVRGSIDQTQTHRSLYSEVKIKNDTPYFASYLSLSYLAGCESSLIREGIASGYTWQGPERGPCLLDIISAGLRNSDGVTASVN